MFLSLLLCAGMALPMDTAMAMAPVMGIPAQSSYTPEQIKIDVRKEIMKQIASTFFINRADAWTMADAAIRNSKRYGVPLELILSVAAIESAYNKNAVSSMGAIGVMQVMPDTAAFIARNIGVKTYDIHDIRTNIRFGTWYLKYLNQRYHDYSLAVRAYNCGPYCVDKVRAGIIRDYPRETRAYHIKVLETVTVIEAAMPYIVAEL